MPVHWGVYEAAVRVVPQQAAHAVSLLDDLAAILHADRQPGREVTAA